ncbi:type I restriction enzyme, R subunit [Gammaproteobacteria bacterium]
MNIHHEIEFENDICSYLAANGWLYGGPEEAKEYDRALALYPADVMNWVRISQPETWKGLKEKHGAKFEVLLLERIRKTLDTLGTLDTLRRGVELVGLRKPVDLCQFRPAFGINATLQARYAANLLRVVRQVRYSLHCEKCIDLVLFLNGLPMATVELKTDFTQNVKDAIDQYRYDRSPKTAGKTEPLLSIPGGALVHFAVSNSEVYMTTRLEGANTKFLPFNRGNEDGAGNPTNPKGYATAYLWEEVWVRETFLDILGRYLIPIRNQKKQITNWIFPRYHQLDATQKLVAQILKDGPGHKYLIQHSAGSGKTNSIAWMAHFLADLHDVQDHKLFDTVVVVSDRTVLDSQLQEAIESFSRTPGVVECIKNEISSKSQGLHQALSGGKKIVVCTLQTFPALTKVMYKLAGNRKKGAGKRFVVIADEAHSSQTGNAAAKLKAVLSPTQQDVLAEGGEMDTEDLLAEQMAKRAQSNRISYIAFTATPKSKTLQLFGTLPEPTQPAGKDNLPRPFHVYSMRQAIEEGFILDVLKNYTSYKMAFRLTHQGKEIDDQVVDTHEAMKGIMDWVRWHPHNIASRVKIVIEHFRDNVAHLLDGKAKAMVVTSSRKEAVRWMIAMQKYSKARGYPIGLLVAFSGEVEDLETSPEPFTESNMNPGLQGKDIREAFDSSDYRILLVANKFQTGFDQPLLVAMYVDKQLGGVQAVQTLCRLNRAFPGKETTYVIDFVNDSTEILESFRVYYTTAELAEVTDPATLLDLRAKLDTLTYYDNFEIDRVIKVAFKPKATQKELDTAISPVANRLLTQYRGAKNIFANAVENSTEARKAKGTMDALLLFKKDMGTFNRFYAFLSQMFDYGNTELEKRFVFFRLLYPLLEFGREREGLDLSALQLTHHTLQDLGKQHLNLGHGDISKIEPEQPGGSTVPDKKKAQLAEIIQRVNNLFEGDLTENDCLVYVDKVIKGKLLESQTLQEQAVNNTKDQFSNSPDLDRALVNAIMDALAAHQTMSRQALNSKQVLGGLRDILLGPARLYETLRG